MSKPQPHTGRTLLEIFWEELDEIMDRLMEDEEPKTWADSLGRECAEVGPYLWTDKQGNQHKEKNDYQLWAENRGQAQGVAYCIAVMTNPYSPDIDRVRTEAMNRWENRNESE